MQDRKLLQRIDACRPGSEDRHDPELAPLAEEAAGEARELYERVSMWDQAIGEALENVRVPPGLSDRLLARLAAEQTVAAAEAVSETCATSAMPTANTVPRRHWLRWSIGLAAAASIAGAAVIGSWLGQPALTADSIREQALLFAQQEEPYPGKILAKLRPIDYPLSRHVYRLPGTIWRPVYNFMDQDGLNGVAYELMFRGSTATLYVVPAPEVDVPRVPPARLGTPTGGRSAVAWQENGLLYVLVVQGSDRDYQSFVKRPTTA